MDRFGIKMLYETLPDGPTWESKWDQGGPRSIAPGHADPEDSTFHLRGERPGLEIDGRGVARMHGIEPRMYVYGDGVIWQNVEITFYGKRIGESGDNSSQGFMAGARTDHHLATPESPCPGFAYYGRILYDGRVNYKKELSHESYTQNLPSESPRLDWGTADGHMPVRRWIGYKFVVRNLARDSQVQLELYLDLEEGENGGNWQPLPTVIDHGQWHVTNPNPDCGYLPNKILTAPGRSIFIRNTLISRADYSKFSIREIAPLTRP